VGREAKIAFAPPWIASDPTNEIATRKSRRKTGGVAWARRGSPVALECYDVMHKASPLPPLHPEAVSLGPDREVVIGEVVGRGASSTVYRGILEGPHRVRRVVAVKVFDALASEERDQVIAGLARATRNAACVHHPNVASPQELAFASSSEPVIVSEWVDGVTLERFIQGHAEINRRVATDLALFIALEAAEGLTGARDAFTADRVRLNMGHHGLSGREVLLSIHGEVKVCDFGLALALRSASGVLQLRSIARRVATLPPEVAHGSRGDARSDVFSLGMMLREMLVGPRFSKEMADHEILQMARDGQIHSSPLERHLPEPLGAILRRAIEIEPARRHPHAGILADELRRACTPMGVGDGRVYLRQAIEEMFRNQIADEEPTVDYGLRSESGENPSSQSGQWRDRDSGARLLAAEIVDEGDD
jgi:eukaryotic-like serine/threonine-protein kinase